MAIDLDGTLLQSDKRIGQRTIDAVSAVLARGIHVVLATARPPRGVRPFYELLGLQGLQVNYNGALIHHMRQEQHVYHMPLDVTLARDLIVLARQIDPGVVVNIEILDRWYTDRVDDTLHIETSRMFDPDGMGPILDWLDRPVTKIMFLAHEPKLAGVQEAITQQFSGQVALAISDSHVIQVVHPSVNKGLAVKSVATGYGIATDRVMAIGDAPNDVEMIRWAGLGVAVKNGWPEARQAADVVVASNDDQGVADALWRYILDR